jgi:glucan phosphoethanolaminetransferase (alkaline phosphatase superfamily)
MNDENFYDEEESRGLKHYYGDLIRVLFITAGALMIVALPFFKDQVSAIVSPMAAIFSILVLGLLAGFMSPRQKWVSIVNALVSFFAVLVFEYYAILSYKSVLQTFTDPFFSSKSSARVYFFCDTLSFNKNSPRCVF